MYALHPWKTYLLASLRDNADAMKRVRRILGAIKVPLDSVRIFTPEETPDVAREINAWSPDENAAIPWQHQRALVFTAIRIEDVERSEPLPAPLPEGVTETDLRTLLGYFPLVRDTHNPDDDEVSNFVCWNTQDFGVMLGCPHGCRYCGIGEKSKMTVLGMNLEDYMNKVVGPTIERHPGQKCFRLLGWSADITTFEPEYGAFRLFLDKLAEYDGRYGYFHTAGDNVDWIKDLPHRDRLIGVWSLTCDIATTAIEPGSPSPEARIAAAEKCRKWGLPVRFKFKPTIPVRNWRHEYARLIELIFRRTVPESLGFALLMWMTADQMRERIDTSLLDPRFVREAERYKDELRDVRTGPFPHALRAEVYRFLIREVRKHDKHIPLYISTESREMWDDIGNDLGQDPHSFICGCNPIEPPGPTLVPSEQLAHSTYFSARGVSDGDTVAQT